MELGAKLLISLVDLRELGVDGVQLGGDGHYARLGDDGAENGEN